MHLKKEGNEMFLFKFVSFILLMIFFFQEAHSQKAAWHEIQLPSQPRWRFYTLLPDSNSGINYINGDSLYRSTDSGSSWTFISDNFLGGEGGWTPLDQISIDRENRILSTAPGGLGFTGPYLIRSTNFGVTWDTLFGGVYGQEFASVSIHPLTERMFVYVIDQIGGYNTIYYSDDHGITWHILPPSANVDFLVYTWCYSTVGTIIAGGRGFIYRSTDNGINWDYFQLANIFYEIINSLAFDNLGNLYAACLDSGLYKSIDLGENWQRININNSTINSVLVTKGDSLFVSSDSNGVYFSTDYGISWHGLNGGLPSLVTRYLVKDNSNRLYLLTPDKLYKYGKFVSAIRENKDKIQSFQLHQNYPNPFNAMSTITVEVYQIIEIELSIFDVMGKKIRTLIKGNKNPGIYIIPLSSEGLASGVYYYKLKSDQYNETKKFVVLK
jgi:photosystem II stability/assembly factor-like uncharacterized protein